MPHSTTSQDIPLKCCTKCGEENPATAEYFHQQRGGKYGLRSYCKKCSAEDARAWRENNRERHAANSRAWHAQNQDRHSEYLREWGENDPPMKKCTACAEKKPATIEYFCRQNPGKYGLTAYCKACKTKRQEDNREHRAVYAKARRKNNRERDRENARAWRKNNPAKYRAIQRISRHQRRARILAAEGNHTVEDIQQQYKNQRGRCYYCQIKVGDTYHVDHVIPLSRGGSNDSSNLVIACPACNLKKNNKLPHEWPQGGRLL